MTTELDTRTQVVHIRLPKWLVDLIDKRARKELASRSQVARQVLAQEFGDGPTTDA